MALHANAMCQMGPRQPAAGAAVWAPPGGDRSAPVTARLTTALKDDGITGVGDALKGLEAAFPRFGDAGLPWAAVVGGTSASEEPR
jgi:hypothetical protein